MPIRVLVSTDGSKASRETLQFVARLGRSIPLEVVLVHVLNLKSLEYKMIPDFQVEMIRDGAQRHAEDLLEEEARFLRDRGVSTRTRLPTGLPGPEICALAESEDVALAVTGRRGHSDLQDILFGSISNHVVHHCRRPVLVVKGAAAPSADRGETLPPLRILVGIDGSEASRRCLSFLASLAPEARAGLALTLMHAINPERSGLRHLPEESREEALESLSRQGEALVKEAAEQLAAFGFRVDTRIARGRPGEVLCQTYRSGGFDLLVLGRRGLGEFSDLLFGAVGHHVIHHCPGQVLVVP